MIDLFRLKCFFSVIRQESFSKAAKELNRSQPAISNQIKHLEKTFGVKLFKRLGPMKVIPTQHAHILAELAGAPVTQLYDLENAFKRAVLGTAVEDEISISTHESVIAHVFPDIVKSMTVQFKNIQFKLYRREKSEIIMDVLEGRSNFGITTLHKAPRGIIKHDLESHKRMLVIHPTHPLASVKVLTIKNISRYPIILPPRPSETRTHVDTVFKKHRLSYSLFLEFNGQEAVKKYVANNLAISIINDYYLTNYDNKYLKARDVSHIFGQTDRCVFYRKGSQFSPIHHKFLSLLIQ